METWKQYLDTGYEVSDLGKIRNINTGRIIKDWRSGMNYRKVQVGRNRMRHYVHRIVAEVFCIKCGDDLEVDHIDRNRSNNSASNLRWVSHTTNMQNTRRNQFIIAV